MKETLEDNMMLIDLSQPCIVLVNSNKKITMPWLMAARAEIMRQYKSRGIFPIKIKFQHDDDTHTLELMEGLYNFQDGSGCKYVIE